MISRTRFALRRLFSPKTLLTIHEGDRCTITLEWAWYDLWSGCYFRKEWLHRHIWVCIMPMFPLHIKWLRTERDRGIPRQH